jgi:unsaturated rhamnogalacturonyl hydrolase
VIASPSTSVARRNFFLLFAACVLLLCPSLFADTLFDFTDFASFADKWLQSGCTSANGWCGGFDYDISGTVDAEDLLLFSQNWLTSKEPVLSDDIAEWILHHGVDRIWNYDRGFLLLSLYEKYERCHNPVYLKYIKDWVDALVSSSGVISGYTKTNYILDHVQPGNLCLAMYRQFGTAKYKTAADTLISQLTTQPTTFDGGFWHKNSYKYQMWLDGIYMAEPFAAQYANMFNAPQWFDVAAFQSTLIATHTQDTLVYPDDPNRKGLCYHGWADLYGMAHANPVVTPPVWADPATGHSPEFWGRAIGWYAMALVDCLDNIPADHNSRPQMITILNTLAAGLAYYQDPNTGMWWQVVNKGYPRETYPTNYTESSCTAMFSYAIGKAVEKGYIASDPNYYLAVSRTGYEGLVAYKLSYVGGYISLKDTVSVGSLSGAGDYNYYVTVDHNGLNDFKGVGALMRAALQYEKLMGSSSP